MNSISNPAIAPGVDLNTATNISASEHGEWGDTEIDFEGLCEYFSAGWGTLESRGSADVSLINVGRFSDRAFAEESLRTLAERSNFVQHPDGTWSDQDATGGRVFASFDCLVGFVAASEHLIAIDTLREISDPVLLAEC